MADKVQLIKEEIERLKHNTPNAYDLSRFMLLEEIESFIDSLPEESTSENLEESAYEYANDANHYVEWSDGWETDNDFEYVNEAFKAGAEWQKNQMMRDAVDGIVCNGIGDRYVREVEKDAISNALSNFNFDDKVKIIFVKEN